MVFASYCVLFDIKTEGVRKKKIVEKVSEIKSFSLQKLSDILVRYCHLGGFLHLLNLAPTTLQPIQNVTLPFDGTKSKNTKTRKKCHKKTSEKMENMWKHKWPYALYTFCWKKNNLGKVFRVLCLVSSRPLKISVEKKRNIFNQKLHR